MVQKLIDFYLKRLEAEQRASGSVFKRVPSMGRFFISILLTFIVLSSPIFMTAQMFDFKMLMLWFVTLLVTLVMMSHYNTESDKEVERKRVERFEQMKKTVSVALTEEYVIHEARHIKEFAEIVKVRIGAHERKYSLDMVYLTILISSSIAILNTVSDLPATFKFAFVFGILALFFFARFLVSFLEIISNKRHSQLKILHEILEELYLERAIEESKEVGVR